jgi:superfamily II DNA or RNA helicase
LFLIVDEVHGIGAPKNRHALLEDYKFRLGLSATPKRWFDDEGTEELVKYFGDVIFEFSLRDAINTINPSTGETYLVPYEYRPCFVKLTEDEFEKYEIETNKIAKAYYRSKNKMEKEGIVNQLCFKRQKIIENAMNKYNSLSNILEGIIDIKYCLIYCSPKQIDNVQDILNERGIIQHKFTMKEGVKKETKYGGLSERSFLIRKFGDGTYQSLVAMRCLDEGVDIPPARIAIIMASTGNPRQYIQRRGRVLRRFPGKDHATIYDIIVTPNPDDFKESHLRSLEKRILEKELRRYKEFAYTAVNTLECLSKIEKLEEMYRLVI